MAQYNRKGGWMMAVLCCFVLTMGGNITVIRKAGVKHHPHSLPDPAPIVDFMIQHTHHQKKPR